MSTDIITDEIANEINAGVIEKYLQSLPEKALSLGIRVLLAALLLIIGLWLAKILRKIVKRSLERSSVETGSV